MDLPTDLYQGATHRGPDDGAPNEIIKKMMQQAKKFQAVGGKSKIRSIRRNSAHYLGISRTFQSGDLVFSFSEARGDPVPHQKLKVKWSGH